MLAPALSLDWTVQASSALLLTCGWFAVWVALPGAVPPRLPAVSVKSAVPSARVSESVTTRLARSARTV